MAENEAPTGQEWNQAVEDQRSGDPAKAGQAYETLSYDSQQIEKADGGGEPIDLGGPAREPEEGPADTDPGVHDHSDGGVHNYEQEQDQRQDQQQEQDEPEQNQNEQDGPELTPEDQKQDQEQDLDEPEPDQNQDQNQDQQQDLDDPDPDQEPQQDQGSSIFDQQMEAGGDRLFGDADSSDGLLSQLTDHTAQLAEDFMSTEGGHEPDQQQPDQQQQTGDISAALDSMQQSLGEAQDRVDQSTQRESEMDQQQEKQGQEQSQDQGQEKAGSDNGMEVSQ